MLRIVVISMSENQKWEFSSTHFAKIPNIGEIIILGGYPKIINKIEHLPEKGIWIYVDKDK